MKNSKRYQLECERHLNCIQDHKVTVNIRAAFTADISHVQCKLNFITFHVSALIFYVVTTDLGCCYCWLLCIWQLALWYTSSQSNIGHLGAVNEQQKKQNCLHFDSSLKETINYVKVL